LRLLAATQQRLGSAQTAIIASDKGRAEGRIKLEKEKERLEELWNTLDSPALEKKPFVWEIDFAEVFADGGFDIVIANPPYVRQEKIAPLDIPEDEITKELRRGYKEALVRSVTAQWGNEFKKDLKSDLYVYFYYIALGLLKPRGVFCFISSNSWLDVGFGAKLQAFLLRNIETKAIYDNLVRRVFAEASINTIIVVFKRPKEKVLTENLTRFVAFKKPFEVAITDANLSAIADAREKLKTEDFRYVPLTQGELWKEGVEVEETKQAEITGTEFIGNYAGNKWGGKYLRAPDIFFTILEKGKGKFKKLGTYGRIETYLNTGGADKFYFVKKIKEVNNNFSKIKNMEYGDEFEVESKFLQPVIKSSRELSKIIIENTDVRSFIILIDEKEKISKLKINDYIQFGVRMKYNKRSGPSSRIPWWKLPIQAKKCGEILIPRNFNDKVVILYNPRRFVANRFYRLDTPLHQDLIFVLNSSINILMMELFGRRNLGLGALDLEKPELKVLPVIDPKNMRFNHSINFLNRPIKSIFEE
jgi:hypothetical protein